MTRIAIHGFGRIGRSLMKAALQNRLFVPVSVSDIRDIKTLAALFEVDSNYGRWSETVSTKGNAFVVGENVLDEEYQEALGYPALGRSVRGGLRYRSGGTRP